MSTLASDKNRVLFGGFVGGAGIGGRAGDHSISACMVVGDGSGAPDWARAGFDRVIIGSDVLHLLARIDGELSQARSLVSGGGPR